MTLTGALAFGRALGQAKVVATIPYVVNADLGFLTPKGDEKDVVLTGDDRTCQVRLVKI